MSGVFAKLVIEVEEEVGQLHTCESPWVILPTEATCDHFEKQTFCHRKFYIYRIVAKRVQRLHMLSPSFPDEDFMLACASATVHGLMYI